LKENYIKFDIMQNNMFERIKIIMRKNAVHRNSLVYNRVFKVYKHSYIKKDFLYIFQLYEFLYSNLSFKSNTVHNILGIT